MDERHLLVKEDKETYGTPMAWLSFIAIITMLMAFDVTCLHPPAGTGRMSFGTAVKLTGFWFGMGLVYDVFLLGSFGWPGAVGFLQGFLLEYMLSFDNLFVFHLVFGYYCTPEHLIYRALYYGIVGAVVFRMIFLLLGGTLFAMELYFVKFVFGAVLIWSGIKSVNESDEEETSDPTNNPFIAWVTKHFPVSDNYEPNGHFFVTVAEVDIRPNRNAPSMPSEDDFHNADEELASPTISSVEGGPMFPRLESFEGSSLLEPQHRSRRSGAVDEDVSWQAGRGDSSEFEVIRPRGRLKRKASLLALVVVAVWVVDLVFAIDSVASKLAMVDDIFLNCASSAFAMMSLRSLYFVMESLVDTFQMLKYGIAAILVLLGLKLIFARYVEVSGPVCFAVVMAICAASVASSYYVPQLSHTCARPASSEERRMSTIEEDPDAEQRATRYADEEEDIRPPSPKPPTALLDPGGAAE